MVIYYWLCSLLDPVLHNKLWDFQNMVLRKMFRPVRKEMREDWKKMRSEELHIMNSSPNIIISFGLMIQIIWRWSDQKRSQATGMWQIWEGREMHTHFWLDNLKEGDSKKDPDIDGRTIVKRAVKSEWTGMNCIWLAGSREHGNKTFGFHTKQEILWPAEEILASQRRLSSTELVAMF